MTGNKGYSPEGPRDIVEDRLELGPPGNRSHVSEEAVLDDVEQQSSSNDGKAESWAEERPSRRVQALTGFGDSAPG